MSILSKIRSLRREEHIVDEQGRPTPTFMMLWQQLFGNAEYLNGAKQEQDGDLDAIAALEGTGLAAKIGADSWAVRTLQPPAAGFSIANPAGIAGDPTFALTNDLAGLEGLSGTGIAVRTAADTWINRSLQAPAAGFTVTNPAGVAGDPTFVLANDLGALEALSGTHTIYYRSAADTWSAVTIGTGLDFTGATLSCTVSGFTSEDAQDAVGNILTDTATIDFTYNDGADTITADVKAGSIGPTQLADTAVTPGTYGDSTHVGQFTVDQDGRITFAASVSAASGGTGSWVPLASGAEPLSFISDGAGDPLLVAGP